MTHLRQLLTHCINTTTTLGVNTARGVNTAKPGVNTGVNTKKDSRSTASAASKQILSNFEPILSNFGAVLMR